MTARRVRLLVVGAGSGIAQKHTGISAPIIVRMLPASYATGVALVLALGGALACFAGYGLFRVVLAIAGFLAGAYLTMSYMGSASAWTLVVATLAGGLVGAVVAVAGYFAVVGLIGAGLAALALNVAWRVVGGDPPTWLLVVVCVCAALAALSAVRIVAIFGTAIAGSWTLIVAGLALAGDPSAMRATAAGDVWILYPLGQTGDQLWHLALWFGLTVAGVVVQFATTGRSRGRRRPKAA